MELKSEDDEVDSQKDSDTKGENGETHEDEEEEKKPNDVKNKKAAAKKDVRLYNLFID